jgi:hypothetical protein
MIIGQRKSPGLWKYLASNRTFHQLRAWFDRLYPLQLLKLQSRHSDSTQEIKNGNTESAAAIEPAVIEEQLMRQLGVYLELLAALKAPLPQLTDPLVGKFLLEKLGWRVNIQPSLIPYAGRGLFLSQDSAISGIPAGTLIGLYPGTVYMPWDPIFFQSLGNSYIIRLSDGSFIDGKSKGISRWIYRSLYHKYRAEKYYESCDLSWQDYKNPFALGQIVNNSCPGFPANVTYYEIPMSANLCSIDLSKYTRFRSSDLLRILPNTRYSIPDYEEPMPSIAAYSMRMVGIVTLRAIYPQEELYSTYMSSIM